jgi:hypothetical protein
MTTPNEVWHDALLSNWERDAILLPPRKALMSLNEAFDYLCWLRGEWCARRSVTSRVHFATERGEIELHEGVFPSPSDGTFEAYSKRVTDEHNTRSFLLYVRNVSKEAAGGLAGEMEEVLIPLWAEGLRWRRLEVELFIGKYDWTSIGIHRERCGNIHQVLWGNKEMIVWPPEALFAKENMPDRAIDGATFKDASRAGLLDPGRCGRFGAGENEAIYWPSGHWHVGISDRLSVSLDLSLYGCDIDIGRH